MDCILPLSLDVSSLVSAVSNNLKDVHEQVDDVKIEVESCKDVFLGTERVLVAATDHQLGVVDDVQTEDDAADAGVDKVQCSARGEEQGDESEYNETHQYCDQYTSHGCEIDLGLESKDSESEGDSCTDSNCHEDLVSSVGGGDRPEHEPLGQGEQAQEDEVVRSFPPDSLTTGQADDGDQHDDQGNPPHLRMLGGIQLHLLNREDSNNSHCHNKLHTKN